LGGGDGGGDNGLRLPRAGILDEIPPGNKKKKNQYLCLFNTVLKIVFVLFTEKC
jgi:hypothetical protein